MAAENGESGPSIAAMILLSARVVAAGAVCRREPYEKIMHMFARTWKAVIALVCVMGTSAAIGHAAESGDVDQLIATDKRMQHAFVDHDIATLGKIFTDDYIIVLSNGTERTKAMILADVSSPDIRWEVNETSGWEVRVHGDMAIVVATLHQKGVAHGKPFDSNVKFSDTYIRDNGRWRNVHAHASKAVDVAPPSG